MLRVGLTGDLGSGKSTVARLLAAHGANVLSSDEMARSLMQPGQPLFSSVVDHFGSAVIAQDGALDRRKLASLAFDPARPRIDELNALVHPAVIVAQLARTEQIALTDPRAIVVVESALIFATQHGPAGVGWRERFDRIVLVTAPEPLKIARFVQRVAAGHILTREEQATLEADARHRLAAQHASAHHAADCLVLENIGTLAEVAVLVDRLWSELQHLEAAPRQL